MTLAGAAHRSSITASDGSPRARGRTQVSRSRSVMPTPEAGHERPVQCVTTYLDQKHDDSTELGLRELGVNFHPSKQIDWQ